MTLSAAFTADGAMHMPSAQVAHVHEEPLSHLPSTRSAPSLHSIISTRRDLERQALSPAVVKPRSRALRRSESPEPEAAPPPEASFDPASYLAPLIPMVSARDAENRRQAICALANLTDDAHRAAVAALADASGRSLLSELLGYSAKLGVPPLQRREAVAGIANLLAAPAAHHALEQAGLLGAVLQLTRSPDPVSLRHAAASIAHLCANGALASSLVDAGFAVEALRLCVDATDLVVRRHAAAAAAALARPPACKAAVLEAGGVHAAVELTISRDGELRRHGGALACNLCLGEDCRAAIVASPLLPQLLRCANAAAAAGAADDVAADTALALAALCVNAKLHASLCAARAPLALIAVLLECGGGARASAAWAVANLAAHAPSRRQLLDGGAVGALVRCAAEGSRAARRDAHRALCWLAAEPELDPSQPSGALRLMARAGVSVDVEVQQAALLTLATWCERHAQQPAVVYGGALPALVFACTAGCSAAANTCGARALACLAAHAPFRAPIVAAGALPHLLRMVAGRAVERRSRANAARALCNLAREQGAALALQKLGAQSALLSLSRDAEGGLPAEYASKILARLDEAWRLERERDPSGGDDGVEAARRELQPDRALCGRVFGAWRVYAATRRVPLEPERAAGGGGGGGGALGAAGAAAAVAEEALGVEEAVARIGRVLLEERARVMDLFTKWDTNKDGYVSKREFREAMAALQIPVRGEDVLALFAYFDPDESGAISFQELNIFFRSSRNSMAGSTAEAARAAAGAFT